ncbi:hypothetical protein ACXR0O_26355 [Verrucomicrobiota bacterium sgz303538]
MLAFAQVSAPILRTQLGVAHIGGLYSFSETDYLNEGAAAARAIGARCIKVSLSLDTDNPSPKLYPFHSQWPSVTTLDALADTPYYRALFAKEFDTFILTAFRPGRAAGYWRESFSPEDEQAEEECFASLTRHLLRAYAQTRKTFIIQNWEGDWALRGSFDPAVKPTPTATTAMIRWLAARQRGVARARREQAAGDARVLSVLALALIVDSLHRAAPSASPVDLLGWMLPLDYSVKFHGQQFSSRFLEEGRLPDSGRRIGRCDTGVDPARAGHQSRSRQHVS